MQALIGHLGTQCGCISFENLSHMSMYIPCEDIQKVNCNPSPSVLLFMLAQLELQEVPKVHYCLVSKINAIDVASFPGPAQHSVAY